MIGRPERAGAGKPAGRHYHVCFGSGSKLQVFDVWDFQESFETFGTTLMPILQEIIEFPSYEDAMADSTMPETGESARKLAALCDGPPTVRNLDVVRQETM